MPTFGLRPFFATLMLASAALLSACGGGVDGTTGPTTQPVATVTVTAPGTTAILGFPTVLTAAMKDAAGLTLTGRVVTWSSSSDAIATVSAGGVVTGMSVGGPVTITATSEGKTGAATLQVAVGDLTAIVEQFRSVYALPALGAAIVTKQGVGAIGVSGTRRFGTTNPVTVADKWHIGSDTKAMTAFIAAMAVEQGLLTWNDLMTARYTQLAPVVRAEFATIALRELAGMNAGIVGNPSGFTPAGTAAQMRNQVDTWAVAQPPAATRGAYYYSNIAYQILGEIAARAFGLAGYQAAVTTKLWTPLGITNAGLGPTTGAGQNDQPIGHTPGAGGTWVPCEACDNMWAAGSGMVHMPLGSWGLFMREILRADVGQSALLNQTNARSLTAPGVALSATLAYGRGWTVRVPEGTDRFVTHDGTNTRNHARASVYLDRGFALLLVTNAGDGTSTEGGAGISATAFNELQTRLLTFYSTGH